jgi:hypothetical protein
LMGDAEAKAAKAERTDAKEGFMLPVYEELEGTGILNMRTLTQNKMLIIYRLPIRYRQLGV